MVSLTRLIDLLEGINRGVGLTVRWCVWLMLALQFGVVLLRYVFGISYIFFQEGMIYLHAMLFMLGAGYTLVLDQHVRVDILYSRLGARGKAVVDALGGAVLLVPSCLAILFWTWPFVRNSWRVLEGPMSVGGIPASFLLKSLIPAFCVLLLVQGVAAIVLNVLRAMGLSGTDEAQGEALK